MQSGENRSCRDKPVGGFPARRPNAAARPQPMLSGGVPRSGHSTCNAEITLPEIGVPGEDRSVICIPVYVLLLIEIAIKVLVIQLKVLEGLPQLFLM